MDLIDDLCEIIKNKDEIKLYFLLNEKYNIKTVTADAVKAGFDAKNLHFLEKTTKSHDLANSDYMCSDELLFRHRNRSMPTVFHTQARTKHFTALVRTHKLFRVYIF